MRKRRNQRRRGERIKKIRSEGKIIGEGDE
jgi:hypothetical protein